MLNCSYIMTDSAPVGEDSKSQQSNPVFPMPSFPPVFLGPGLRPEQFHSFQSNHRFGNASSSELPMSHNERLAPKEELSENRANYPAISEQEQNHAHIANHVNRPPPPPQPPPGALFFRVPPMMLSNRFPPSPMMLPHGGPFYIQLPPHAYQMMSNQKACSKRKYLRRASFTTDQRKYMEDTFKREKYINKATRRQIAEKLGIDEAQVKTWFQNRRMKWRTKRGEHCMEDAASDAQSSSGYESACQQSGTEMGRSSSSNNSDSPSASDSSSSSKS